MPKKPNTSWGKVADWYEDVVEDNDSYQNKVILPNILRLMEIKKGEKILDVGCGTGFFSREFAKAGGEVIGIDVGEELIEIAKNHPTAKDIKYHIAPADQLSFIPDTSVDKAVMVLSLQNILDANKTVLEISRILKTNGRLYIVLNHPAFRIPGASSWGWDERNKVQYRRVDEYLSEKKAPIQMHPGADPKEKTWSFHRPLQFYFKTLGKSGFLTEKLEEWVSHRKTEAGPRKRAEDKSRTEIPLFMVIQAKKG